VKIHMESVEFAKMLVFGLGKDAVVVDPPELWKAVIRAAHEIFGIKTE